MIIDYITKIKLNITIYTNKKTTNLLDGTYNSIYKGRSMNFEDLREYVSGDNIKDIDWKASARSNSILVRQYIAEKKHNIMLVFDTGRKMLADTKKIQSKKDVAILTGGTIAYLANKNGDNVGSIYNKENLIQYFQLKTGLYNIERILSSYEKDVNQDNALDLERSLRYIVNHIKRKMIIFVITDIDGITNIKESTIKELSYQNDVMFINISDADITGGISFDIEQNLYIPNLILNDSKLHDLELQRKELIYKETEKRLQRHGISCVTIDSDKEIVSKIFELLERHKYANNR